MITLLFLPPEPEPSWSILLAVGVAVALTLAVALVLGFITPRCSHWLQKFVHSKDPLPDALVSVGYLFICICEGLCRKTGHGFCYKLPIFMVSYSIFLQCVHTVQNDCI